MGASDDRARKRLSRTPPKWAIVAVLAFAGLCSSFMFTLVVPLQAELPQLLNVITGDMSLVGPRPHALAHDREFERKIALYARRHNVKPGITGWAQVNGLRGETDTDEKMAARVACDHWYIDNWSFSLDMAILFRTVFSPKAFRNAG